VSAFSTGVLTYGEPICVVASGSAGWALTGNSGTNPSTNFIGTTDNVDFVIRRNNVSMARFMSGNNIGIGSGALTSLTTGDDNVAIGSQSLRNTTT
jgi:trimeric autotransporter adhesin